MSKQLISKHDRQQIALRDMRAFPECERGTDVEIEYQPDSTQRNELDDPYCHARGSWQPRENRRREQSGEGSSRSVSFLFTDFMEGVEREALLPATPHRSPYCQTARAGVPPSERLWGRAYDAKAPDDWTKSPLEEIYNIGPGFGVNHSVNIEFAN